MDQMDSTNSTEKSSVDLENGQTNNEEDNTIEDRQPGRPMLFFHNNILRNLFCMDGNVNSTREERIVQEQQGLVRTHENEKSKRSYNNNKKKANCCKPPRPPKGPSLDASDVKLIKEISQLAMKKRARVERMKALRKMKEVKSSSSPSTPSRSSISAMIITILFFLVLIFQGLNSKLGSRHGSFQGSPEPAMAASNSLISVQFFHDSSGFDGNAPNSGSPYTMEHASGSDNTSPG